MGSAQAPGQAGTAMEAASDRPAISTENLTAGYDGVPVLRDVTIEVRAGEAVALLGANGAGKSTLVMSLAGVIGPISGTVSVSGVVLTSGLESRVRDGGVAVISQERSVFMTLTARQNILLGGGDPDEAVSLFPELREHMGRRVGHLSGGQQQMLSVARAICANPKVLIADEVSLGLAPLITDRLLAALASVAHERGVAVLFVEQFVGKALKFSDRAYVLRRGSIAMSGSSTEMLERESDLLAHYL